MLTLYRDNCRCPKCVNQETMQRSFNILTVSWESSKPGTWSKTYYLSRLFPPRRPSKSNLRSVV
jgi:hypothetical protein